MNLGDFIFALLGLWGVISLVYNILNWTLDSTVSLWQIGIGITVSLILGIIPWLISHRLKQRENVGILFLVAVIGSWLTLKIFSLGLSDTVEALFSSLDTIAFATGYWCYGRYLFHKAD